MITPSRSAGSSASRAQPCLGERPRDFPGRPRVARGGDEERVPRVPGKDVEPLREGLLEGCAYRERMGDRRLAQQFGVGQGRDRFEDRERVAPRLSDDPVPDGRVDRRSRALDERRRVRGGQPVQLEGAEPRCGDPFAVAHPQQQQHALAAKTAPGEQQRLARGRIEPVRIVHDDENGRFLGGRRQEAERRRSHGEPVARHGRPERQRTGQRGLLGTGNPAEQVQDRAQQLGKTRERQLRFRLERTSAQHLEISRRCGGVLEQPRLPDARLTVEKQRRALAAASTGDQAIELRSLVFPADQHRSNRNSCGRGRTVPGSRQT